jgi:hypothetical protein
MIWKQVDIVTMLEAAIDYVKYLQDQVKVNLLNNSYAKFTISSA